MKHAIIFAHPSSHSLTARIAGAYAEAVRADGGVALIRDLYGEGFDPLLKAEELPGSDEARFAEDVQAERLRLSDCDTFALIYPLWFNAPPAMLKGYVDRVFSMGFGYEPAPDGTSPLLSGKRLISFTTSGAPEAWFRDTGAFAALTTLFDAHLATVTGLRVIGHVHNGGVVPGITAAAQTDILDRVQVRLRECLADDARPL